MRHEKIKITRDAQTVHNLSVAPWEVPVLEVIFGEGNVTLQGEFVPAPGGYPDPGQEMTRLQKVYGADAETGEHHVATVYGKARSGVKALGDAIAQAKADEAREKRPTKACKALALDPLLA
jgi:hypothetical protein